LVESIGLAFPNGLDFAAEGGGRSDFAGGGGRSDLGSSSIRRLFSRESRPSRESRFSRESSADLSGLSDLSTGLAFPKGLDFAAGGAGRSDFVGGGASADFSGADLGSSSI